MNPSRVLPSSLKLFALSLALPSLACGSFSAERGLPAQALIMVVDGAGNPVPGATVWVPADSGSTVGIDTSGLACAPAPEPVLFASCTGDDGIALLECLDEATFLFQYSKDGAEGTSSGKCGDGGIIQAPLSL